MGHQDTRDRILDAAERLFAQHGFSSTSLRAVTGEAEVNLAAVNYHFGSKNSLLEAIMERRITPLNNRRLEMLNKTCQCKESMNVRNIISSFIKPTLQLLNKGPQKRYFIQLVGRVLAEQDGPEKEVFHHHMLPIFPPFIASLRNIRPNLSRRKITWGLLFSIGAITFSIRMFCNPDDFLNSDIAIDLEKLEEMLINFVTSGLEATYA